ncbi:MAG: LysE family translocator [Actinomycetota bacterium]
MPPIDALLAFAVAAAAIIVVPGPSVMFVVGRAVALGRRAAVATVVGNAAGVYLQVVLVAVGLGVVVERSIVAFTAVKLLGAAYLVWLGIGSIRSRHRDARVDTGSADARSLRTLLTEGFVVGAANPKTIVFFAAILPQFARPEAGPLPPQLAVLGVVFVVVALVLDTVWALAAGTARAWFARSPQRLARLSAVGGTVMIGLGVRLAMTGRSD